MFLVKLHCQILFHIDYLLRNLSSNIPKYIRKASVSGKLEWKETRLILLYFAANLSERDLEAMRYFPPRRTDDFPILSSPVKGMEKARVPSFISPS